jgi:hypothetical protein
LKVNFDIQNRVTTYSTSAKARLSMFSLSRLVVGSSNAKMPQFKQNVSAKASLIIKDAKTYKILIHCIGISNMLSKAVVTILS